MKNELENLNIYDIIGKYIYNIYKKEYCKIIFFAGEIDEPTSILEIPISESYFLKVNIIIIGDEFSPNITIWCATHGRIVKI